MGKFTKDDADNTTITEVLSVKRNGVHSHYIVRVRDESGISYGWKSTSMDEDNQITDESTDEEIKNAIHCHLTCNVVLRSPRPVVTYEKKDDLIGTNPTLLPE
jgi:hypothetical protein